MTIRVWGPTEIRPDQLWPRLERELRWESPEWFDEGGQLRPPPAHVELFIPDEGDPGLSIGYDGDDQGAPLAACTGERVARTVRWEIPRVVVSEEVYERLAELVPDAQRLVDGYTVTESPRGWHPKLTDAATLARTTIGQRLGELFADAQVLEIHSLRDIDPGVVAELVTAELRDEQLPGVVETLRARIAPARPGNLVVLDEGLEDVRWHRNAARARVRDRLAITATLASGDRRERDELLRRIAAWDAEGDSYRALGKLVGLSHTKVRTIVAQVSTDRDEAIDHLDATVRALRLAWDPPHVPAPTDPDRDADERAEWEEEQQWLHDEQNHTWHTDRKRCTLCGKPSRRLVRRWQQVDEVSVAADEDDPHRSETGYVSDLSHEPRFDREWAVCGTVCARQIITTDRTKPAHPRRVAGNDEFHYALEPFRYQPHDSELPEPLVDLRAWTQFLDLNRTELERAITDGKTDTAAMRLTALRRDIARIATVLASLHTFTPPTRTYTAADPEPADAGQVRHGDVIYSDDRGISGDRPDHWRDSDGSRYTWKQLTALGELVEIPRDRLIVPTHDEEEPSWRD